MHSWDKQRPEPGHRGSPTANSAARGRILLGLLAGFAGLTGCASPGPPLPPSLKLPEVVQAGTLTATRVGDQVMLHWTTPSRTTDKLPIMGPITAEICREPAVGAPAAGAKPAETACSPVVQRVRVAPGASDAVDTLPPSLMSGPTHLLAYRVQLRNAAGRTAGASLPVFAASGPSLQPVEDLRVTATKAGAVLEWKELEARDREGGTNGDRAGSHHAGAVGGRECGLGPPAKQCLAGCAKAAFRGASSGGDGGGSR
jgi:hypothetical protein